MSKYKVSYTSGASGVGWDMNFNTIKEVEAIVQELKRKDSAMVTVYDCNLEDYIYYKRCLTNPEIDLIFNTRRDLRTKTKMSLQFN